MSTSSVSLLTIQFPFPVHFFHWKLGWCKVQREELHFSWFAIYDEESEICIRILQWSLIFLIILDNADIYVYFTLYFELVKFSFWICELMDLLQMWNLQYLLIYGCESLNCDLRIATVNFAWLDLYMNCLYIERTKDYEEF